MKIISVFTYIFCWIQRRFLSCRISLYCPIIQHKIVFYLEHKEYHEISIVDICKEAELSRKTFYHYFKHKDDLLDYLAQIICLCYSRTDDRSGHYHYFNFFYHMQNSVRLLLKNDLWYDVTQRTMRQYEDLLYPHDWEKALGELWCKNGFQDPPEKLSSLVEKIQSGSLVIWIGSTWNGNSIYTQITGHLNTSPAMMPHGIVPPQKQNIIQHCKFYITRTT